MSDIERRPIYRPGSVPEPTKADTRERRDPTEWRPKGQRDDREHRQVSAVHMRSEPLNHQSLADLQPGVIAGIEANARGDLIRQAEREGYSIGERGVRVHWQLVVEGYCFPYPEGYVHPDAPEDVQHEGRAAWKRAVEIASDSFQRSMFVALWRRRSLPPPQPEQIVSIPISRPPKSIEPGAFTVTATDEDDVVEGEIVE